MRLADDYEIIKKEDLKIEMKEKESIGEDVLRGSKTSRICIMYNKDGKCVRPHNLFNVIVFKRVGLIGEIIEEVETVEVMEILGFQSWNEKWVDCKASFGPRTAIKFRLKVRLSVVLQDQMAYNIHGSHNILLTE